MIKPLIVLLAFGLMSCSSQSTLRFSVDIETREGVDPFVARKIVLAWLQQRSYQSGGAKVIVEKIPGSAEAKCNASTDSLKIKHDICGAEYSISTPWIKNEGYSQYFVHEDCSSGECTYRVAEDDYGVEEQKNLREFEYSSISM